MTGPLKQSRPSVYDPAAPTDDAAREAECSARTHVVFVGHVDHGKSTIIGRLLADTDSLPVSKIEQVRVSCERTSKPFEYAFLLDALKDEQAQGITIEAARVFFRTARRFYAIIDTPGHVEFLKNMITGASRADAAFLVVDAHEGLQENTLRHATMLSMLGVDQIVVLVNKMDLVAYAQATFDSVVADMREFLQQLNVRPLAYIPVSGRDGENIGWVSSRMPWYGGTTVHDVLDEFVAAVPLRQRPFRMPVQDVYKFTKYGDHRRIVAGTVESGSLRVGDQVVFYPSGRRSRVTGIEAFSHAPLAEVHAGSATGFTLDQQIYVTRGELVARAQEPKPHVTTRLRVSLFWLGRSPLFEKKDYVFKLGTARVSMRVESIERIIEASNLQSQATRARVERHEVADCVLRLQRPVAFDLSAESPPTGRFVIVDGFEISGGGIVREALADQEEWVRDKVLLRNARWESSLISPERRAERYNQKAMLLLITGQRRVDRKGLAKELEAHLFEAGKIVYFLGMGNVLYGLDADVEPRPENRLEHFRRLGEVANILLDAGLILIVSAAEVAYDELKVLTTSLRQERVATVWVGDLITTDLVCDLVLTEAERENRGCDALKELLQDRGVIFRVW
jgi:bifunctional enzyme CysN/CysC